MKNRIDMFFALGRPFGPFYSALMKMRERLYTSQIFNQHRLSVPVVSVGNLVLGGTGKTPTVRHIAELLTQKGLQVAIVSRGYGGKAKQQVNIVSDRNQTILSAVEAGDEPRMLAELLPGVVVLTGAKRIHPCRFAIEEFEADIIILDDGFQHLSVARDIDTVLFDATTLAGSSRVFPGGPLREPVSSLKRCSSFLITSLTESNEKRARLFSDLLRQRFPEKPVFFSTIEAENHIVSENKSVKTFQDDKYFAFCGIANPIRFKNSLASTGINTCGFMAYNDHASYDQKSMLTLFQLASKSGAQRLITTEKDYVKIQHLQSDLPLHVLKIRQEIENTLDEYILRQLNIDN